MPMTGAERVAKHRQRQVDRIAQLERELADLKNQQPVSNFEIDASGHKLFSVGQVARVTGVTEATVLRAVEDGELSASQPCFTERDVSIWANGKLDLSYEQIMERVLEIAEKLEENK